MSLFESFQNVLRAFGMEKITHPLFYNAKIALRFDIGGNGNDVYVEDSIVNPEYVNACFERVIQIFARLKTKPDLLVIDGYIYENETVEHFVSSVIAATDLPQPDEINCERVCEDEAEFDHIFLCWKSSGFNPNKLFREIILADLGSGHHFLTSSVYFVSTKDNVLFHLYDDRGADLIAEKKENLCQIYQELNHFILEHDRAKIDATFRT